MPILKLETWDGVTAPSIPSGWTVGSSLQTTSSLSGGLSPISTPNVLELVGVVVPPYVFLATWGTADSNSGNVTVRADVSRTSAGAIDAAGVMARGNSSALSVSSSTFYWANLNFTGATIGVSSVVSGTQSTIGSLVSITGLSAAAWYTIAFTLSGISLSVTLQRASDGYWLNSSGAFVSGPATVISVTDSSISGAGYAGLALTAKTSTVYTDNWSLSYGSGVSAVGAIAGGLDTFVGMATTFPETAAGAISNFADSVSGLGSRTDLVTGAIAGGLDSLVGAAIEIGSSTGEMAIDNGFGPLPNGSDLLIGQGTMATVASTSPAIVGGRDRFTGTSSTQVIASMAI